MSDHTTTIAVGGTVDTDKTVKAGCGIRYDPDVLGEDNGFDFSDAEKLKPTLADLNGTSDLNATNDISESETKPLPSQP